MKSSTRRTIHDCFISVIGHAPTPSEIADIYKKFPSEIINIANQWGWYDAEVQDKIYLWIKENIKE